LNIQIGGGIMKPLSILSIFGRLVLELRSIEIKKVEIFDAFPSLSELTIYRTISGAIHYVRHSESDGANRKAEHVFS
jgi:hypothetical protein